MMDRSAQEIRQSLQDIVRDVHNLTYNADQLKELDDVYANLDLDELEVVECISYIRTAYRCRDHLQQWYQFTDKAYWKAVEQYGEKRADHIFRGLR